ncbi:MAG: DNA-binding transcriptional regulator [Gammaproteobacteria bacterium]|nr:DNA-binding transcriptional regulator [Gammaproteobacteria bacterium]
MKEHKEQTARQAQEAEEELARAFQSLQTTTEYLDFLRDLCTPAELEALADRWRVVGFLEQGRPYREIHDITGVSVTTVGRVARFLEHGNQGYRAALTRLGKK